MAKFMLVYKGSATRPEEMTEEARNAEMQRLWGAWMGKVGDAMADAGAPFGASTSVRGDGTTAEADNLTGYTIVEADDLTGAQALCDSHPFIRDGGDFSIEVYELIDMGM